MFRLPKFLSNFILLFTLSTVLVYPQGHPSIEQSEITLRTFPELSDMTYDDVMTLLDDFETGAIEYKYSPEDIDKAIDMVIMLARNGVLPNEDPDEMERDIQELLYGEEDSIVPAFFMGKEISFYAKIGSLNPVKKQGNSLKRRKKQSLLERLLL